MKYTLGIAVFFLWFTACIDPFEFDTSSSPSILVVDGQFTTSGGMQELRISSTLPFGDKFFDPVSGAEVTLHHDEEAEKYDEVDPGVYRLSGDGIIGVSGEEYFVEFKINGETYRSTPAIMPSPQPADTAFYRVEEDIVFQNNGIQRLAKVINVFIDTDIRRAEDKSGVYIKWLIDELYLFTDLVCSVFDNALTCYIPLATVNQNIQLFGSTDEGIDRLNAIKVFTKSIIPLVEFTGRHYFNVYQQAITKEAFEYWSLVQAVSVQEGTVFDTPPASIPGNIVNVNDESDKVLGFFELTSVDTVRTFIYAFEFKELYSLTVYCNPIRRFELKPECCECRTIPNATTIRPVWVR